jgi:hypothetical protein
MLGPSSFVVAAVLLGLFYLSFDSGAGGAERAPGGIVVPLLGFSGLFAFGAWALAAAGERGRSRYVTGVAMATGLYGLGRLLFG